MLKLKPTRTYTVPAGGATENFNLDGAEQLIIVNGSVTLAANYVIDTAGTPITDMTVDIKWLANVDLNGSTVTVFGVLLTQQQANTDGNITCIYNGATWDVIINSDTEGTNPTSRTDTVVWNAGGGTTNVIDGIDDKWQIITGNAVLVGSWVMQGAGVPGDGDVFIADYRATLTVGGNTVTIFGLTLTTAQALAGRTRVWAVYDGTAAAYRAVLIQDVNLAGYVETSSIANNAVDLAKMAGIARGSLIVGDSLGDPAYLDLSTDNDITGGDGNDVVSLTQDAGASTVTYSRNGAGTFSLVVDAGTNTLELYDENPVAPVANTVAGNNAVSIGENNTGSGANALALGDGNTASNTDSVAIGDTNTSSGLNSTAIGNNNSTTNTSGVSIGDTNTNSSVNGVAIGNTNAVNTGADAIAIGISNTSTGVTSAAIGANNIATGDNSTAIGQLNTATGDNSTAIGHLNVATGDNSTAIGKEAQTTRFGQTAVASDNIGGGGNNFSQVTILPIQRATTDATPDVLTLNGQAPAAGTFVTVEANSLMMCQALVTCVQESGAAGTAGDASTWKICFDIKNVGGTTALIGTPVYYTDAGTGSTVGQTWANDGALVTTVVVTADNTNDSIAFTITGEANKNLLWHCALIVSEIKYG